MIIDVELFNGSGINCSMNKKSESNIFSSFWSLLDV